MRALLKAMRPHQWAKNLLVIVPAFMAQVWTQPDVILSAALAFIALSLAASGGYLINDLIDIEADRRHPEKRHRPLAAGDLSRSTGLIFGVLLICSGTVVAFAWLNPAATYLLLAYVLVSFAYSVALKRWLLIDVIVLAGLYTLRLMIGGAAAGVVVSSWLLLFSMFFFLSLAFAKRLAEFQDLEKRSPVDEPARPYAGVDNDTFRSVGPTSGMLSVLVLALYIASDTVQSLYNQPQILWLLCPLMLYWILRTWFITLRGQLHYDPVVFALRDRVSYAVTAGILMVIYLASR